MMALVCILPLSGLGCGADAPTVPDGGNGGGNGGGDGGGNGGGNGGGGGNEPTSDVAPADINTCLEICGYTDDCVGFSMIEDVEDEMDCNTICDGISENIVEAISTCLQGTMCTDSNDIVACVNSDGNPPPTSDVMPMNIDTCEEICEYVDDCTGFEMIENITDLADCNVTCLNVSNTVVENVSMCLQGTVCGDSDDIVVCVNSNGNPPE